MLGNEERDIIIPAIQQTVDEDKVQCFGPYAADGFFGARHYRRFDGVLAMYHDQGHIPLKVSGFVYDRQSGRWDSVAGVNITLGLPIIRVSVDHGTGEGHAGDGGANVLSLKNALDYANLMARSKMKAAE